MINRKKIKKFVKNNQKEIIDIVRFAVVELFAIASYTWACKVYGYRMVKPLGFANDEGFWVETISGKKMVCQKKNPSK